MSKGPHALTAVVAAFAASWRFSNYTVRDGNYRSKESVKTKEEKIRTDIFLESILLTTMASDSANRAQAALVSSSTARRAA